MASRRMRVVMQEMAKRYQQLNTCLQLPALRADLATLKQENTGQIVLAPDMFAAQSNSGQ